LHKGRISEFEETKISSYMKNIKTFKDVLDKKGPEVYNKMIKNIKY